MGQGPGTDTRDKDEGQTQRTKTRDRHKGQRQGTDTRDRDTGKAPYGVSDRASCCFEPSQSHRITSELVAALSPVNHTGLHQG